MEETPPPFEFGKCYELKLLDPDADDQGNAAVLFKRGYLKHGETLRFKIVSKSYTITMLENGAENKSEVEYRPSVDEFEGVSVFRPTFELMGARRDLIIVDCSSVNCHAAHYVDCTITEVN